MIRVHKGTGIDLQRVIRGVLEQTVHGIHEVMRQLEKPLPTPILHRFTSIFSHCAQCFAVNLASHILTYIYN